MSSRGISDPSPAVLAAMLLLAGGAVPTASAHEFWIAPSRYRATTGDVVVLRGLVGEGLDGERLPYSSARAELFAFHASGSTSLTGVALDGEPTWARLVIPDVHGIMVAFQSRFTSIELAADTFDAYLEEEGLDGPRAARARLGDEAGPGRERYRRCAKAWIAGSAPGSGSERALRPAGMALEIVPLTSPGASDVLTVEVLFNGRPLADALVRAWHAPDAPRLGFEQACGHRPEGPASQGRTDARGRVTLTLAEEGEWLLGAVHMIPCLDRSVADWESSWASLTFVR